MTTNPRYNPIFRATRLALAELSTPDARRWYRRQFNISAALAHQGVTYLRRRLSSSRGPVAVEPVQEHDVMATEPAAVSAPAQAAVAEQGDIPAAWAAIEGNDSIAATLSEQAIAVAQTPAPAADLEPEPESLDLAATEHTTATDYELLDDSQELPTEADEPLVDDAIPFSDDLESGSPFQEDEDDTSFYDPETEDDSSDSLLEDDLEPSASVLPSDLNERVTAYLQAHRISPESDDLANSHSFTPVTSYSSSGAEVGE